MRADPRKLFGDKLRMLRKELGWSQERLAFECGLDRTYIGGIEQGRRNVSLLNICKIAKGLKVKPHNLLEFDSIKTSGRRGRTQTKRPGIKKGSRKKTSKSHKKKDTK